MDINTTIFKTRLDVHKAFMKGNKLVPEDLYMECKGNKITCLSYDHSTIIETTTEFNGAAEKEPFAVKFVDLHKAISQMGDVAEIIFSENSIQVKDNDAVYTLQRKAPKAPTTTDFNSIKPDKKMLSRELQDIVTHTAFMSDDQRYEGIFFIKEDNKRPVAIGTDGRRLSRFYIQGEWLTKTIGLQKHCLKTLSEIGCDNFNITYDDKFLYVRGKWFVVRSALCLGSAPRWERVVQKQDKKFMITKEVFLDALKRVDFCSNGGPMMLKIDTSTMDLEIVESNISGVTTIPISSNGKVTIRINPAYILQALNSFDADENITVTYSDDPHGVIQFHSQTKDYLHMIMPMRQ